MGEASRRIWLELGVFDPARRALVRPQGEEIPLTPSEARLLVWLGERPHEVHEVERLLREVWGYKAESRTVYVTVSRLRAKIERDPARPRHLLAAASAGYRFEPLPAPQPAPSTREVRVDGRRIWGREAEIERIQALRAQGGRRLTLTGPGGIGKTTLARAALDGDEVVYCDASADPDLQALLASVYRSLGLAGGAADLRVYLGAALRARGPTLLLLDNLEQVAGPARELLDAWLEEAPQLAVLATSRLALQAREERVIAVGPLALPEEGADLETLAGAAAVGMLLELAAAARPGLRVDAEATRIAARLARELDGVPLCLSLVAARARTLTLGDLQERLARRPLELLSDQRARLPRQRDIRATVRWSLDLLPDWARACWAALSVFVAPFTLARAEAVLDPPLVEGAPWAADVLDLLVDASLLQALPAAREGGPSRYAWLQSIRSFAEEHAAGLPTLAEHRARHAACFAARWSLEAVERLVRATEREARAALREERPDLERALSTALERRDAGAVDALLEALLWLGRTEGPPDAVLAWVERVEAAPWLDATLALQAASARAEMAASMGRSAEALPALRDALARHPDAHPRARFAAKHSLVLLAEFVGDRPLMRTLTEELVEQDAVALGPLQRVAADQARGINRLALGDPAGAERDLLRALQRAREFHNDRYAGVCLLNLGGLYRDRGQHGLAITFAREAAEVAQQTGDLDRAPMAWSMLGKLELDEGRLREAIGRLEEAQGVLLRRGMLARASIVLGSLGTAQWARGENERALASFRALVGDPGAPLRARAAARAYVGGILAEGGRAPEARLELERALEEARERSGAFAELVALGLLARLERVDHPARALSLATAGVAVGRALQAPLQERVCAALRAEALARAGELTAAQAALAEIDEAQVSALAPLPRLELTLARGAACRALGDAGGLARALELADALIPGMALEPGAWMLRERESLGR